MTSKAEPVSTVINGHTFTIDARYNLKDSRILGKGSFGVVCTAKDTVRNLEIAIKRIRPYCNDEWDARHTLREIRLLKLLGPHPNVSYPFSVVSYFLFYLLPSLLSFCFFLFSFLSLIPLLFSLC